MRVVFDPGTPDEVIELLSPLLDKWQWVVPPHTYELRVMFHPLLAADVEPGTLAALESSGEYGEATLHILPIWLTESKEARERVIVHELAHILVAPLAELADTVIDKCMQGDMKVWADEQSRRACEWTTVNVAEALMRKPKTGSARKPR